MIGLSTILSADYSKINGVVTDNTTKLEWQDDYSNNGGDIKKSIWIDAIDYCENLSLDSKNDWRLPNLNELKSLIDRTKYAPAIVSGFANVSSSYYWSATSDESNKNDAWLVFFSDGFVGNNDKNLSSDVRCVRAGE